MMKRVRELLERSERRKEQSELGAMAAAADAGRAMAEARPIKRPNFWPAETISDKLVEQDGNCAETGEPLRKDFEVDHDIPFCYGGGNEAANIRLVNKAANRRKGHSVDPRRLVQYLEGRLRNEK